MGIFAGIMLTLVAITIIFLVVASVGAFNEFRH
jgi:hypothetical protein